MARRRGRPRTFDEDEVKAAILQQFWETGFAGTSLDAISEATGLARPSLYGAFGDKAAMYRMSMDVFLERLGGAREALSRASCPEAALVGFFDAMLDVYLADGEGPQLGCFLVGTALAQAPRDASVRAALADRLERMREMLERALGDLAPDADADDVRFAAEQAAATLHSLAVRARAGEPRAPLDALARRSARLVASTLSPRE